MKRIIIALCALFIAVPASAEFVGRIVVKNAPIPAPNEYKVYKQSIRDEQRGIYRTERKVSKEKRRHDRKAISAERQAANSAARQTEKTIARAERKKGKAEKRQERQGEKADNRGQVSVAVPSGGANSS